MHQGCCDVDQLCVEHHKTCAAYIVGVRSLLRNSTGLNPSGAAGMRCMCSNVSHMVGVNAEFDAKIIFDIEAGPLAVSH